MIDGRCIDITIKCEKMKHKDSGKCDNRSDNGGETN